MHLEYSHCKTIKVQCQNVFICWVRVCKIMSVQYHKGLQLLHFVLRHTLMVQYQLVGSCAFACVQLCFCGQRMKLRMLSELPETRWVRQGKYVAKQCTVQIVTAKRARYSCQQIATAELIIAKLPQYNTISYGLYFFWRLALQNTYGRLMVHGQPVCSCCPCVCNCALNLWAVNALRIWSQLA